MNTGIWSNWTHLPCGVFLMLEREGCVSQGVHWNLLILQLWQHNQPQCLWLHHTGTVTLIRAHHACHSSLTPSLNTTALLHSTLDHSIYRCFIPLFAHRQFWIHQTPIELCFTWSPWGLNHSALLPTTQHTSLPGILLKLRPEVTRPAPIHYC